MLLTPSLISLCNYTFSYLPSFLRSPAAAADMAGTSLVGGGALLYAFLQVVFDLLASQDVVDYFHGNGLHDKLKLTLLSINAVIDDAEDKHYTNQHVKDWLDLVKDAVLDAEDLLDEIHTEASKSKLLLEPHQLHTTTTAAASKVWSYFSPSKVWSYFSQVWSYFFQVWSYFSPSSSSVSSFDKELQLRMKDIIHNLESLASQKDILGLKKGGDVGVGSGKNVSQRLQSTSLVNVADVCGRVEDKKVIIDLLLSHNDNGSGGNNLSVISIVGMGGMGKTTLAQLVFNDGKVEDEFQLKAWVCVSDDFDIARVTRTILKELALRADDNEDLNALQVKLKEKLSGKKFLLVLDDVWEEKCSKWEALKAPFVYGARGSKILVTTRSKEVASTMRCAYLHQLKQLSEEQSWSLFAKYAFCDDANSTSDFEEIGRKIIKKCNGLPLALKAIGSLLYTKSSKEEWNGILTSEIWDIPNEGCDIIPALRLSYQYLPSPLKRCFAYCSLFPKDYEFEKDYLVELWMAENFLPLHQQSKNMKDIGDQYFSDLLSRSFFQQSDEELELFVMHDLVNDLAKYVSGEFSLRLEKGIATDVSKMTRHFSYIKHYHESPKRFEAIDTAHKLRTLLNVEMQVSYGLISSKMLDDWLSKFKCLRVLSLCCCRGVFKVPDTIGNLKHLRYLNLSDSCIQKLPDSICLIYNLQILKLKGCHYLQELPSDMHKLINLCHLDLRQTNLKKLPNGLWELKKLEILDPTFCVGKHGEPNLSKLAEVNKLYGSLSIKELQNVADPMDALAANMKNETHLMGLSLEWSMNDDGSENERNVLEKLQPPTNLKWLFIQNYGGTRFPDWFGDNYLSNIVSLALKNCKYCFSLPPLGILPLLKNLEIVGLEGIRVIGPEFYGNNSSAAPFGSLESLKIKKMEGLEEWDCQDASRAFPCLTSLEVTDCPQLKNQLPGHLPFLRRLEIRNCMQLVASLPNAPAIHELCLHDCGNLQWEYLASTLNDLSIGGQCMEISLLEKFIYSISNTCLERILVDNCPIVDFLIRHPFSFLQNLHLHGSCGGTLKIFPLDLFPKLRRLYFFKFSSLERFSISDRLDESLTSLTYLRIHECPEFVSFPEGSLASLTDLTIEGCPKFVSFPEGGFSAPNLQSCYIRYMESLKSFPKGMHTLCPSVTDIILNDCPQLECPEGGWTWPSNLKNLHIQNCPKLFASGMKKWGLHTCTSLRHLVIEDANVDSFPDQGLLPATLTSLSLLSSSKLHTLDYKGLCHLSSLKDMYISDCPRLQCLPKEGLPKSLSQLLIYGDCPLLKQRCQKQRGEDWIKIAHIPYVQIDGDILT